MSTMTLDLRAAAGGPRRTAHEYVRASLRAAILGGDLPGGSRLVQADIARELGVSTTPVREALRDLATEGLVTLDAHRGGIVKRLTYDELREIIHLCRILEPEAMRQVAEVADDELLAAARELFEQMETETDPVRWTELNREFHAVITNATPSERLRTILRGLRDSAAPYVALATRSPGSDLHERANAQHLEILEALAAGDADRCAELTRVHVDLTIQALERARAEIDQPSPM
jgi:DNA-binding GntR family transcriptional regulator